MKSYRFLIQQYHIQNIKVYITLELYTFLWKRPIFIFIISANQTAKSTGDILSGKSNYHKFIFQLVM